MGSSEVICGLRDIAPLCLQVAIAVLLEAAHEYVSISTPLSALLCPLDLTSDHCHLWRCMGARVCHTKRRMWCCFVLIVFYIDSANAGAGGAHLDEKDVL